jgi:SAM-dependent methyltransferase
MKLINVSCDLCGCDDTCKITQGLDFEYRTSKNEFYIVKCNNCGFVYLNPRPDKTELGRIYPENYVPYVFDEILTPFVNNLRIAVQKSKVKSIKNYASTDAKIWDVGCGGGFFLDCMKKLGDSSWELSGVDISRKAIEKIRSKGFSGINSRFEDIEDSNCVDLIVINQVLEHLDSPSEIIKKSYDLLNNNGYMFIEIPSLDGWDAQIYQDRFWGGWHFPRHWSFFTQDTITKMLEDRGFDVVQVDYLFSPTFWILSLENKLKESSFIPKFVKKIVSVNNVILLALFCSIDLVQKILRGRTSNMRVIAKKRK